MGDKLSELELKTLEVDGVKTRYIEEGDGDPVLLIHGGQIGQLSTLLSWGLNLDGLSKEFRVIAFDKLGQGFTDNPRSLEFYTSTATNLHAYNFMKKLGISKAHVVGHSRGGFVATSLALEHREMVRSLTLVDSGTTAPDDPPRTSDFYVEVAKRNSKLTGRDKLKANIIANSFSGKHITEPWIDDMVEASELEKTKIAYELTKDKATMDVLPDLMGKREMLQGMIRSGELKQPTLLFWGYNDPSALFDRGVNLYRMVAKNNPETKMHVVNEAGHYSFREHPKDFNEVLASFANMH